MSDSKEENNVYLIFTDIVSSCDIDNKKDVKGWRNEAFFRQLKNLLIPENAVALKSIGDALFIVIEGNQTSVKTLLTYLCDAVQKFEIESDNEKVPVEVRAVMHKIDMCRHTHGTDIINRLKDVKNCGDFTNKSKRLVTALDKDVFGIEVNKASRILSLLTGASIILTEEVVRAYCKEEQYDFNLMLNNPPQNIGGEMQIHSPFPILKLKGFKIEIDRPLIVWHLSKTENSEKTLSQEYKKRHSFRLLTTITDDSIMQLNNLKELRNKVINQLQTQDSNIAFSFYTDFFWNVVDYVELTDINFSREHTNNTRRFSDIYSHKCKEESHHFYKYSIVLNDDRFVDFTCERNEKNRINRMGNTSHLTSLVVDSFSEKESSQSFRNLFSFKRANNQKNEILSIVPQTVDVYNGIDIFDYKKASHKNELWKLLNNPQERFLLVFFQFYMDEVDNAAAHFKQLFNVRIPSSCGITLVPIIKGYVAGLIDGFVIYYIEDSQKREKIEPFVESTKTLLSFMINTVPGRTTKMFYNFSYPSSIFFLKNNENFNFRKENYKYLMANSNLKDNNESC